MNLRNKPVKKNQVLYVKDDVTRQTKKEDLQQFQLAVTRQDAVKLLILPRKFHGQQNAVEPFYIKKENNIEQTKCGSQDEQRIHQSIIKVYKPIDKGYQRYRTKNIGQHHLSDIAHSHGHHPHNPAFWHQEKHAASIFAQPVRRKYGKRQTAKDGFNGFP